MENALFEFVLRQGDNALILGHRVSEWCGMGPALEEDIALANTALDLIGQAQMWLALAGETEGAGRTADDLAFHREAYDFRNLLLVERPNGDFGQTMMRQFLFDTYHLLLLDRLGSVTPAQAEQAGDTRVRDIALKAVKEVTYHAERSADLVIRLGDGSEESHRRMQAALDDLWPYTGEMLHVDDVDLALANAGVLADPAALVPEWTQRVRAVLEDATLVIPESDFAHCGGKDGRMHSEHLGHLLAVMQSLPRSHPEAVW